ncbi:MAG TPA: type II CAAX endopeptidase family protein [Xanthobacteraceae bacterium]|nr:type II CAAX endopeptidase family protein [Xanthobacteraceae bacterium]
MSTMDVTYLPQANALPAREVRAEPSPWGFWGSLGWGLFAMATGMVAAFIYTMIWMLTHQLRLANPQDPSFSTAAGIATLSAPLIMLAVAVKIRKFSLRDYFALNGFARRDLVLGIAGLIGLIVVFSGIETLLGIDGGSKQVEATYRAAKAAGVLPLLWLSVVVVAPVTEELFFRGFLHRGWAPSWLGVAGTIVVTSAVWALLHQQYNALGILLIFAMGLIFGWMRQRSGSTSLPIVLHMFNNLLATVFVTVNVEWLG